MPKSKEKGEKQIKKSVSKKKAEKPAQKDPKDEKDQAKDKSPQGKIRPISVKKNVKKEEKGKAASAQRASSQSATKKRKLKSLGKEKETPQVSGKETSTNIASSSPNEGRGKQKSKKKTVSKSTSRGKERERSRSKTSEEEEVETPQKPTPSKSDKSTPSKGQVSSGSNSGTSSSPDRAKQLGSTGKIPKKISIHGQGKKVKAPAGKKITASKVKESSSNIESSSSLDLSGEQKKNISSASGRRKLEVDETVGPESKRISRDVEETIKIIEDRKQTKKGGEKLLAKKHKRGTSHALVKALTAKDYDYILQKNPNIKSKPYINLEDLSNHKLISYSEVLLSLLEVAQNSDAYLFAYSSKSRKFWSDILEYKVLKKIFGDFKAETLRKYWSELSQHDTETTTDLIKKHKSYLDKLPLKLGTIVSCISKFLNGSIKDFKQYIDAIQVDIRKREIFEHEFKNPVTGETTKVREVRTTYNTRKKYEPGSVKDFKGSTTNIVSLKEIYHENANLTDFQKVMKNMRKDDSIKFTYLNEKMEEDKKVLNTINESDKFVFNAIDNVLDGLSSEFKNYSTDFILETLQQNSMDIAKTYACLKEPLKNRNLGFTPLDDKVLLRKKGEEYKILLKEKGKEAIEEREEFLNH